MTPFFSRKTVVFAAAFFAALAAAHIWFFGFDRPVASGRETGEVDVWDDPEQTEVEGDESFVLKRDGNAFEIIPKARFRGAALVVGTKRYRSGWQGDRSCELFYVRKVRIGSMVYD